MNRWMGRVLLMVGAMGLWGCTGRTVESFTLEVDLPAEFKLKTAANYRPATGQACTLPLRRGKRPERKVFFTNYKPTASRVSYELPLTETVEGCPLVLNDVEFDLYAKWGARNSDVGGDIASIFIRDRSEEGKPGIPESGLQELFGQCQWLFRTVGQARALIKILKCKSLNDGTFQKTLDWGAVGRDQLSGRTLRMAIEFNSDERPYLGDTWIRFPDGWRRCSGESVDDKYGFCERDTAKFGPFKMPDGRECDIYPTCTE